MSVLLERDATLAATLLVVQHGTRGSFRRRVVDAMRSLVPAPAGFCFFGREDAVLYAEGTRVVDGATQPVQATGRRRLTEAFGFEPQNIVATSRRAYDADELYPPEERQKLPYFADHAGAGFARAALFFLHEGGVLFGLAGLERRESDPPFSPEELERLELLGAYVVAGARSQLAYDELTREAAALRAFQKTTGTMFLVDRDRKEVVWAVNRERGVEWTSDVAPHEELIVDAADRALAARARGDAIPTPPQLPMGAVVGVAKLDGEAVFGGARVAALRVEPADRGGPSPGAGLSRREREIARLLVAGYSGVNVAAISGLSENTVRTYVRRLYAKLGVANRADLVRKLMAPEAEVDPRARAASTAPPDSSLVHGDDTLD